MRRCEAPVGQGSDQGRELDDEASDFVAGVGGCGRVLGGYEHPILLAEPGVGGGSLLHAHYHLVAGEEDIVETLGKARANVHGHGSSVMFNPETQAGALSLLCELRNLRMFYLRDQHLPDAEIRFISSLKSLRRLNLSNCSVTDAQFNDVVGVQALRLGYCTGPPARREGQPSSAPCPTSWPRTA